MDEKIIFKDEVYQIQGACFEVYKNTGSGFLEAVYQESLLNTFIIIWKIFQCERNTFFQCYKII